MPNVYEDSNILAGLQDAVEAFLTATPEGFEQWTAFQSNLLRQVYRSVCAQIQAADPQWVPPQLILHPENDAQDGNDLYIDAIGVHAGSGLLTSLTWHLLMFAHFLTDNFMFQVAPPLGDYPSLAAIVTLQDFPAQALTFNAASLVPGAATPAGFTRSSGSMFVQAFEDLIFSGTAEPERLPADLSRRVVKPANDDLLMYKLTFRSNPSFFLDSYNHPDRGVYQQRLFWQLWLDAAYFLLAHELAHERLGHTRVQPEPKPAEALVREAATDEIALGIVRAIPGFLPSSLMMLFAFCAGLDADPRVNRMDHPFSHDRLLNLASASLREPTGADMRLNVNAGMAFLTTPVGGVLLQIPWDDGSVERSELDIYQYADMDYNAHLLFYLERPPRAVPVTKGGLQNAAFLSLHTFQADLVLRDRVNPECVHHRGSVRIRPARVSNDLLFRYAEDRVLTRVHVVVPTPADWWLGHPGSEAVIENVRQAEEPLEERQDKDGHFRLHNLAYDVRVDFDHDQFVQALPEVSISADPLIRHRAVLAARRCFELNAPALALIYYDWLYRSHDPLLQYTDFLNICQANFKTHQWEALEKAAQDALRLAGGELLPGFHAYLAVCLQRRGELAAALEHVFIEKFAMGRLCEFDRLASEAYAEILRTTGDPVMAAMRRFHLHCDAAQKAAARHPDQALGFYRQALTALREAAHETKVDYLFLREYTAEIELDIALLEGGGLDGPQALFETIVTREPWFVPARIQLARIALKTGLPERARALWHEARGLTWFAHSMVSDFRVIVDQRNPNMVIRQPAAAAQAIGQETAEQTG